MDPAAAREALSTVRSAQWQAFEKVRWIPVWKIALVAVVVSALLTATSFGGLRLALMILVVSSVAFVIGLVVWRRRLRAVGAPNWRSAPPELRSRMGRVVWSGMIIMVVPMSVLNVLTDLFIRDSPYYTPLLFFGSRSVVLFSSLWLAHRIWQRTYRKWLAGDPR